MREQLPQLRARLEQLRFRSTRSDSELGSDLAMGVAFDVVQDEHGASPRRQPRHGLLNGLGDESPVGIGLDQGGVVLDIDLQLRDAADLSQGIERTVDRNSMCPRSELRVAAITGERPENLHPYFLRNVRGELGVSAQPPHDSVYVRRVLRPKPLQRALIAGNGALQIELIDEHF